jgi:hypothetical protein
MVPGQQAEDAIVADAGNGKDVEVRAMGVGDDAEQRRRDGGFGLKSFLWHGGSVWDAWFSCASNQVRSLVLPKMLVDRGRAALTEHDILTGAFLCWQVAQVLLTLPYSFSQLGMVSGVLLQVFYGLMGSWTAYLISVLYVEYRARKEKEGVSFKNHVIQVGRRPLLHSRTRTSATVCIVSFHLPSSPASPAHGFCAALIMLLFLGWPGGMGIGSAGRGRSRRAIDVLWNFAS